METDPDRDAPGELLQSGREAEVYAYGEGRVLRRYTEPGQTATREAELMRYLTDRGYPVPRVYDVDERDLVMERLEGPTLLDDMGRRPWRIRSHAALLARLHRRLHAIEAPEWMEERLGGGDAVVHLDLHPRNIVLTERGPVVIDWAKARRGSPAIDVAVTWLILETARVPGGLIGRRLARVAGAFITRRFLHFFPRDEVHTALEPAARFRLLDTDLTDKERAAIGEILERHQHRRRRRPVAPDGTVR